MKYIGVGLLSALAGAGIGVGQLFASLLIAYAKNPSLRDKLFS
jgi:F0F1-type ATP synthase membrane subunit c/vacuolar-type H+-ATPase subunit K